MEGSIVFSCVREANNVLELEVSLDIVSVNEKFNFVDQMCCCFIEGSGNRVDVLLNRQYSEK